MNLLVSDLMRLIKIFYLYFKNEKTLNPDILEMKQLEIEP